MKYIWKSWNSRPYTSRMGVSSCMDRTVCHDGNGFFYLVTITQNWREEERDTYGIQLAYRIFCGRYFSLTQDGICLRLPGCCFCGIWYIYVQKHFLKFREQLVIWWFHILSGWLLQDIWISLFFCWTDIVERGIVWWAVPWIFWNWYLTILWKSRNIGKEYA